MSATDIQSVSSFARDGQNSMSYRLSLFIPDIPWPKAIAWMGGIVGTGWAMPNLFGAAAESAPWLALVTTIAGGMLLVWKAYVERDARHIKQDLREAKRDLLSFRRKLERAGIDLTKTDDGGTAERVTD